MKGLILVCEDCGTGYCFVSGDIPEKCEYCKGKLVEQSEDDSGELEEDKE